MLLSASSLMLWISCTHVYQLTVSFSSFLLSLISRTVQYKEEKMEKIALLNLRKSTPSQDETQCSVSETVYKQLLRKEYEQDNNATPQYSFIIQILPAHGIF